MEERIPKTIPTPQNIKKAIVFFDHCGSLSNCVNIIQGWLTELGYLFKEAAMVVCRYYSNLAELDKEQIYNEFKKAGCENLDPMCNRRNIRWLQYSRHFDCCLVWTP